jgi:hypothetical protein
MPVNKPRNRTLIFRLTQEEYDALRVASSHQGARSLSEFARAKLMGSLELTPLDRQISELSSKVSRIAQLLELHQPSHPSVRSSQLEEKETKSTAA